MLDDEVFDLFRAESREHLEALESSLLDLETADNLQSCRGIIDGIFRRAHSFKGSSRAVGLIGLQDLAQKLEDTLDAFRDDPESVSKESIDRMLSEFDALRSAYENWEAGGQPAAERESLLDEFQPGSPVDPPDSGTSTPSKAASETAGVLDESVLSIFREEVQEHLAALESSLLDLESVDDVQARRTVVDDLFRRAHSLKGSARAVGQEPLQHLAQKLEDTLDRCREDPKNIDTPLIEKALAEFDALQTAYQTWEAKPASGGSETAAAETKPPEASDEKPAAGKPSRARAVSEDRSVVRVPAERLDRMLSMAGELRVTQRGGDSLTAQLNILGEILISALSGCKRNSEKLARAAPSDTRAVRVPNDELRNQLDGAVERLRQIQSEFGKKRFREELMLEALEQDIRTARLVPLASLTDPMRRAVRDLVQSLGKSISYKPDVGDILLDKAVMESLKDPLMHLIRNAADHGIESPHERKAAGKPEEGTITISASRRAESVLIRISDDGGGIKFDRIRQKLKQAGGLDDGEIAALSEKELARFLFQAGFTTRQQATEVSGRGVGMDVVMDAIHRLQGTVELERSSSAGTTFLITVPVTISTARILTVTSGGQRYGIPTNAMLRTGRIKAELLRELEGNMILTVDAAPVRWIDLSDLLGLPAVAMPGDDDLHSYLLLLHEGRKLALAVDDLEDESEVILKSLEFPLSELDEVIGGTIRPDGSVQLVLDPSWIASRVLHAERRIAPSQLEPAGRILVADDSPTTRSIIRNLLSAAGYVVQTAVDGVDALQRLQTQAFDLVVTDVEMPRMNGFELTRKIKSQLGLPVVLVTGLAKEDDRRRGLDAGADAYVVKSTFDDQGLLEIVKQFL